MKYEFAAPSGKDSSNAWAASEQLINLYREPIGSRMMVKPVLGTILFAALDGVFCRAMAEVDGLLYVVHGETLYRVSETGNALAIGTIPDDPNTTISGNNGKVTICAGGNYYLWDGTTLSEPTAGAFSEFGSVTFYKQLTVLTELNGRRVQWSDPAAPATLDGLSFATAETSDEDIIRALPLGGSLWVFKESAVEIWAQTSAGDLQAIPGSSIEPGLKGFGLLTEVPGGIFFIGSDNVPYLYRNGGMNEISGAAVKSSITYQDPQGVAYYEDEGHKFCAILFDGRPAWVFDIVTGEWHERAEGNDLGAWSVQVITKAYGKFIAGTKLGILARFSRVGQDLGKTLVKRAVGRTFSGDLSKFRVHELALPIKVGTIEIPPVTPTVMRNVPVTLLDGTPVTMLDGEDVVVILTPMEFPNDPTEEQIALRVSRDGGRTWSDPIAQGLGLIGEYSRRVTWFRLGQFENFTAEITYAGSADITFDANIDGRAS